MQKLEHCSGENAEIIHNHLKQSKLEIKRFEINPDTREVVTVVVSSFTGHLDNWVPTCTTIYIDARGPEETRTIMRGELVAMYTALDKFATQEWVGIFTDSLFSMQAIRHRYTYQGPISPRNYHHYMLLLREITDLLEERRRRELRTTLHKI